MTRPNSAALANGVGQKAKNGQVSFRRLPFFPPHSAPPRPLLPAGPPARPPASRPADRHCCHRSWDHRLLGCHSHRHRDRWPSAGFVFVSVILRRSNASRERRTGGENDAIRGELSSVNPIEPRVSYSIGLLRFLSPSWLACWLAGWPAD